MPDDRRELADRMHRPLDRAAYLSQLDAALGRTGDRGRRKAFRPRRHTKLRRRLRQDPVCLGAKFCSVMGSLQKPLRRAILSHVALLSSELRRGVPGKISSTVSVSFLEGNRMPPRPGPSCVSHAPSKPRAQHYVWDDKHVLCARFTNMHFGEKYGGTIPAACARANVPACRTSRIGYRKAIHD